MPRQHLPQSNRQRYLSALLATGLAGAMPIATFADETETTQIEPAPAAISGTAPTEMELNAPVNSTLEMRVARRPWLLEKLTNRDPEPSQKMTPPRPPAELPDPPSLSRATQPASDPLMRRSRTEDARPEDGWEPRNAPHSAPPSYAVKPPALATSDAKVATEESSGTGNPIGAATTTETDPNNAGAEKRQPLMDPQPGTRAETEVPRSRHSDPSDNEGADVAEDSQKKEKKIVVRDLRVNRDGTLVGEEEGAEEELAGQEPIAAARGSAAYIGDDLSESKTYDVDAEADWDDPEMTELEVVRPTIERDYAGFPKQPIQLTQTVHRLRNSISQCLRYYYARPEVANERSNWGMMHSIMVYGVDTKVLVGHRSYSAIAWIAGNNVCRGQRLLSEENGRLTVKSGVGLQGHQAQMLAVFSLCDVPANYPLYANDHKYSVRDVVDGEKRACKSDEELTFTLIGLSHYLDTESKWRSEDGQPWDFERLIREELSQPIVGAACGGTHRLMGFAHALRKRRSEGYPIDGQWKRAEKYSQDFITYVYRLQNRDGSMSTDWFEGREDNGDLDRKVQTTGHIVEWLLTVVPDSQLQNPRLVNAIRFLLASLSNEREHDWSIGPKGHALRSLAMYYQRVYQSGPAWRTPSIARNPIEQSPANQTSSTRYDLLRMPANSWR